MTQNKIPKHSHPENSYVSQPNSFSGSDTSKENIKLNNPCPICNRTIYLGDGTVHEANGNVTHIACYISKLPKHNQQKSPRGDTSNSNGVSVLRTHSADFYLWLNWVITSPKNTWEKQIKVKMKQIERELKK